MKKVFKSKRLLAFVLALVLIATTCVSSSDAFLRAESGTEADGSTEETQLATVDAGDSSDDAGDSSDYEDDSSDYIDDSSDYEDDSSGDADDSSGDTDDSSTDAGEPSDDADESSDDSDDETDESLTDADETVEIEVEDPDAATDKEEEKAELTESVERFVEEMKNLLGADEITLDNAAEVYELLIGGEMSDGYDQALAYLESQEDEEVQGACDKYEAVLAAVKKMMDIRSFVDEMQKLPEADKITKDNAADVLEVLGSEEMSDGYVLAVEYLESQEDEEVQEACDKYEALFFATQKLLELENNKYDDLTGGLNDGWSFADMAAWFNEKAQPGTTITLEASQGATDYTFQGTLTIPAGVTLIVKNIGIWRGDGAFGGPLFNVTAGGTLVLESMSLHGTKQDECGMRYDQQGLWASGPLVSVGPGGTFNMGSGAYLHGNGNKSNGGGVYVDNGGTFNFNSGSIVNCDALYGGGVFLEPDATYNNNGGSITGCRGTKDGDDVYRGPIPVEIGDDILTNKKIVIAIIKDPTSIPNEPSVSDRQYVWITNEYVIAPEGLYPEFSTNAADYIDPAIFDDPNFKINGAARGVSDSASRYVRGIDWDRVLEAVASANRGVATEDGNVITMDNKNSYKIYPYVAKYQDPTDDDTWHVDCVIIPANRPKLIYQLNLQGNTDSLVGFEAPAGNTYEPGTNVTVGSVKYNSANIAVGQAISVKKDGVDATLYFVGWSESINGTAPIYKPGEIFQINNDTTLYGVWTTEYEMHDISYTVEYYKDGVKADTDTFTESVLSNRNTLTVQPIDKNKYTDYEFDHYEVDDVEVSELPETVENGAVIKVYYKSMTAIYTVRHLYQNITDDGYTETVAYRQELSGTIGAKTNAQAKTETGFTAKAVTQETIKADGTTIVNIYYDRNVHTVTYEITGSHFNNPSYYKETKKYGAPLTLIGNDMEKAGYEWSGWSGLPTIMPDNDVTVTGHYSTKDDTAYRVEYFWQNTDNDEYALHETKVLAGVTGADVTATIIAYEGFKHVTVTGRSVESGNIAADGSLVLKVYYDRETYKITYAITGELFAKDPYKTVGDVRYGANLSLITDNMQKTGYVWSGWKGLPGTMPNHDVRVEGSYSAATNTKYTVKHWYQNLEDDDYTEKETETQTLTGTTGAKTAAEAKTVTGFTAKTVEQQTIKADGTTVVNIYYDRNVHTVTYQITGTYFRDDAFSVQNDVKYGANLTLITNNMIKAGYTWSGWSGLPTTMPDNDVIVTGYYSTNKDTQYKVEYYWQNANNDEYAIHETKIMKGETGASVTASIIAYEGFKHVTVAGRSVESGNIAADGSLVLKVYYDRETYKITYAITGEVDPVDPYTTVENVRFGTNLSLITDDMEKQGYVWSGWKGLPGTMPSGDVRVTGSYSAATNTAYEVRHLYQNIAADEYAENESERENLTGTTGAQTAAKAKTGVTGFTAKEVEQQTIAADGTTVVNIYYDRIRYDVTGTIDNGGSVTNANQEVAYEGNSQSMTFTAADGYIIKTIKVNGIDQKVAYDQTTYTYDAQTNVTEDITVVVTTAAKNPELSLS
ncbi:MAG: hypothetical protein HDR23_09235, partial [Lachnospiraceae bacterium]|nr:hypothetical protein [Lachnospiraceae bacterium]